MRARHKAIFFFLIGVWLFICGLGLHGRMNVEGGGGKPELDVSPVEDLMREHGVLARILLIYDEIIARSERGEEIPAATVTGAVGLVRRFVEDYHEKLEEAYVFPRFEKEGPLAGLVSVLRDQHKAGRRLTDRIQSLTGSLGRTDSGAGKALRESLRLFNRMYRPHKAREDTVLFPAFHTLIPAGEFDKMGQAFEDREDELFGSGGFERIVAEVEALEKTVGIHELGKFTPGD